MSFSIRRTLQGLGDALKQGEKAVEKGLGKVGQAISNELHVVENQNRAARGDQFEPAIPDNLIPGVKTGYADVNVPLGVDAPSDAVHQGSFGDCYLLSSIAAVAEKHPEQLKNVVRDNGNGTYTVTLYEPVGLAAGRFGQSWDRMAVGGINDALGFLGAPQLPLRKVEVTVDGKMPTANGVPVADHGQQLYPAIIEKAMAKLWGGYSALDSGDPSLALTALTGKPTRTLLTPVESEDKLFSQMQKALADNRCMVAGTWGKVDQGLVGSHAYTVLGVEERGGQKLVKLRNPWGTNPGQGGGWGWGGNSSDGTLEVPLATFKKNFGVVQYTT